MKGNKLIKRIKALQRAAGHDIEIGFQGSAGFKDFVIHPRFVTRHGVTIPFAAILVDGNYYQAEDFIRVALNNRFDDSGSPRCNMTDDEKTFMSAIPWL